jgi:hypothetical protein
VCKLPCCRDRSVPRILLISLLGKRLSVFWRPEVLFHITVYASELFLQFLLSFLVLLFTIYLFPGGGRRDFAVLLFLATKII